MHLDKALLGTLLGLTLTLTTTTSKSTRITSIDQAPLLGPSFPSTFNPANTSAIKQASKQLPIQIEHLFKSQVLNKTDMAIHIDVFSAATNESLFSWSHVGEGSKESVTGGHFNDSTISRIGSVTKLFTVYALIAEAGLGVFVDPVTKYLPELKRNDSDSNSDSDQDRSPLGNVPWEDVTVGALAAHQAGAGGITDFFMKYEDEKDKLFYRTEDLIKFFRDERMPVTAPYHSAIYSDGGFAILGQVLAKITGKSVDESFEDLLWKPLGMNDTSTRMPKGSNLNVIDRRIYDPENTAWGKDIDVVTSTGSIYSSAADLRKAGLSILHSKLLSGPTTSEWMKPRSGTGSLVELVGAPWEITRLEIPTTPGSNRTRISDLYTKGGGNYDYTAIFALSPDHGIGYSILIAGNMTNATPGRWPLRDLVGETFIPAAELAAAENAANKLAGTFVDEKSGSNLTLTVDKGKAGLGLKELVIDGQPSMLSGAKYRLYPTGLNSVSDSLSSLYESKGKMRVALRAVVPYLNAPRAAVEGGEGGLFDDSFVWMNLDAKGPLDLFILELSDGMVESVEYPLNGTTMKLSR